MKSAEYWRDRWAEILVENGPIQNLTQEDLDFLAAQYVREIQADTFKEAAGICREDAQDHGESDFAVGARLCAAAIEARAAELEGRE